MIVIDTNAEFANLSYLGTWTFDDGTVVTCERDRFGDVWKLNEQPVNANKLQVMIGAVRLCGNIIDVSMLDALAAEVAKSTTAPLTTLELDMFYSRVQRKVRRDELYKWLCEQGISDD